MATTRGRIISTRRTVNAFAISLRSRVCSGGSMPRIEPAASTSVPCSERPGATANAREARVNDSLPDLLKAACQPRGAPVGQLRLDDRAGPEEGAELGHGRLRPGRSRGRDLDRTVGGVHAITVTLGGPTNKARTGWIRIESCALPGRPGTR